MLRYSSKIFRTFQKFPFQIKEVHFSKSISYPCLVSNNLTGYKSIYNFSSKNDEKQENAEYVNIIFINKDKSEKEVKAKVGDSLLEVAHQNDIELEGACDSSLACSTCHVILEDEIYESLPIPKPEEEDMLDLAYGLTETSRLGCQVKVKKEFEGMKVTLPKATRNMYVDGHKPKHH